MVNKWDTIPDKNQKTTLDYEEDVRMKLRALKWAPIVYSTAIAGRSVEKYVFTLKKKLFIYVPTNNSSLIS